MTTKKCKVAVFDCKTGKMRIEEREMPVYDPPKLQPSPLETVLYHVCKMLENNNMEDDVIKEYITQYENKYK